MLSCLFQAVYTRRMPCTLLPLLLRLRLLLGCC